MIKKIVVVAVVGICVYYRGWIAQEGQALLQNVSDKSDEAIEDIRMSSPAEESQKLDEIEQ